MVNVCVDPDDFDTDEAGRLTANLSCGLKHTVDGIAADTAAWPHACAIGTHGGPVYCDAVTGRLHGPPVSKAYFLEDVAVTIVNDAIGPGGQRTQTVTFDFDTTDECETLIVQMNVQLMWRVDYENANDEFSVTVNRNEDGGTFSQWAVGFDAASLPAGQFAGESVVRTDHIVLPPGTVKQVRYQAEMTNNGPSNITLAKLGVRVRGLVLTQHL